jgi:V-type H+-transporting ATPase proteolipid subunit
MIFASWGSAWGTWRAGLGLCSMGVDHCAGIIKNIVPIVMAGVLGIYGLIVSVIITQAVVPPGSNGYNVYSSFNGYTHVSATQCIMLEGKREYLTLPSLSVSADDSSNRESSYTHTTTLSFVCLFRLFLYEIQLAAGLCCGLSCLAAGGCIGILGEVGVIGFGIRASDGRKFYMSAADADAGVGEDGLGGTTGGMTSVEGANKLYVGMLIMLIFSEALALYGLIVALILSQHNYICV